MPKEMINVTVTRKAGEPWGLVIVGGKDQSLTVKLGRIKAYSAAEAETSMVRRSLRCPTTRSAS